MKTFRAGPLLVRSAGGNDRDGGGNGPAVLLCHGYGAPGSDLVSLHRAVRAPVGTRWFFPEAPHDLGMGDARAWWQIDMMKIQLAMMRGEERMMADETPAGLEEAREGLEECISALVDHHGVARERLVIGGFSQGAMVTTELALFGRHRYAGLAVLSGTLLCRARWAERSAALKDLPLVQSHGRQDPILAFGQAEALADFFKAAGAKASFLPFNGQHAIPAVAIAGLETLLADTLFAETTA